MGSRSVFSSSRDIKQTTFTWSAVVFGAHGCSSYYVCVDR